MFGTMLMSALAAATTMQAAPAASDVKAGVDAWFGGRYGDAIKTWRPLADRGDADAQFNMGQAYRLGRGVPADMRIAQSWFQKASAQGHAEAQANLGLILYQNGDRKGALPLIRKAAERGDERAQYVLGATLFNGDVEGRDWPRAYALTSLAAEKGLPSAKASLKQMDEVIPAADRERGKVVARQITTDMALASTRARGLRPSSPPGSLVPTARTAQFGGAKLPPTPPTATPAARSAAAATQGAKMEPPARRGVSALPTPAAPVATATAAAPKPTTGKGYRIQLGAYPSPAAARSQWTALSKRVGTLGALEATYEPAGKYTRLRTGPFGSRAEAERACAAAKAAGQACFTVPG